MKVEPHIERTAIQDMARAVDWYRDTAPHLVDDLIDEIGKALETVVSSGLRGEITYMSTRCVPLKHFPFRLWFIAEDPFATTVVAFSRPSE